MNLNGTVVSVDLDKSVKSQAGKAYQAYQIIFTDGAGKVSDITKPVTGLKFTPGLRESLESLSPGDQFTCVMEKQNGFNNVVSIHKGEYQGGGVENVGAAAPARSGKVLGSTYETPEERKVKQRLIVRQSSVNNAIELLIANKGKEPVGFDDVLSAARLFEQHVYEGVE